MGVFRQYERLVLSRRKQKETEDEKETSAGEKAQDWNDLGLLCRGNKHACVPFCKQSSRRKSSADTYVCHLLGRGCVYIDSPTRVSTGSPCICRSLPICAHGTLYKYAGRCGDVCFLSCCIFYVRASACGFPRRSAAVPASGRLMLYACLCPVCPDISYVRLAICLRSGPDLGDGRKSSNWPWIFLNCLCFVCMYFFPQHACIVCRLFLLFRLQGSSSLVSCSTSGD